MLDRALEQALSEALDSPLKLDLVRAILVQVHSDARLASATGDRFLPAAREYRDLLLLSPGLEEHREALRRFEESLEDPKRRLVVHERETFDRLVRLLSDGPFGEPVPQYVIDFAWRRFELARTRASASEVDL